MFQEFLLNFRDSGSSVSGERLIAKFFLDRD